MGENLNRIPGRKCLAYHKRSHPAKEVGCLKKDMTVREEPRSVLLEQLEHRRLVNNMIHRIGARDGTRKPASRFQILPLHRYLAGDRITKALGEGISTQPHTHGMMDPGSNPCPAGAFEVNDKNFDTDGLTNLVLTYRAVFGNYS